MGKRSITLYRNVTGVESIMLMVDDDLDLKSLDEEQAGKLVREAFDDGTCFADTEILDIDLPHGLHANGIYMDFTEINS